MLNGLILCCLILPGIRVSGGGLTLNFSSASTSSKPQRIEDCTLQWTRMDFLISSLSLQDEQGEWYACPDWYAFISLTDNRLQAGIPTLPDGRFVALRFAIGVDPTANATDPSEFPPHHALNPAVNRMHWGWQGGFIFAALEGRLTHHSIEGSPTASFSYHLARDGNEVWITSQFPQPISGKDHSIAHIDIAPGNLFFGKEHMNPFLGQNASHSRDGDPLVPVIQKKLQQAFLITQVQADIPGNNSSTQKPQISHASETASPIYFEKPDHFPKIQLPADNPLTNQGIELGRRLFMDKRLSRNQTQSCLDCHDPKAAFADPRHRYSPGADGASGHRNAMPLFNLAWAGSYFWDGRAPSLREQSLMPIQDPLEMHESLENVVIKLAQDAEYTRMFAQSFRDGAISPLNISLALEQFLLTLISSNSRFDKALRGELTLSAVEKRGLELFVTEYDPSRKLYGADCFHCHGGPLFSDYRFTNNGLEESYKDVGYMKVTHNPAHSGFFKTPSLRNIEVTAPYMHDGRFATLEEVVEHYNSGIHQNPNLDPNIAKHPIQGLSLSQDDKQALVHFLKCLTDIESLESSISRTGRESEFTQSKSF